MSSNNTCMGIFQFDKEYYPIFDHVVKPVVETHADLIYQDARSFYEAHKVKMEIIEKMIVNAKLIVVDISEKNPNVFMELGIAFRQRKPIIYICKEEKFKDVWKNSFPFDIQGREAILYKNEDDLKFKFSKAVFDATFTTEPVILSYEALNATVVDSSNLLINRGGIAVSDFAVSFPFIIQYTVFIRHCDSACIPDVRLSLSDVRENLKSTLAKFPPTISGQHILVIYPWELTENREGKEECHIDLFRNAMDHDRMQQVGVRRRGEMPIERFDFSVTFGIRNLVVESSLFEIKRLIVPIEVLRQRGYPLHKDQYIYFYSHNCDVEIQDIKVTEIER